MSKNSPEIGHIRTTADNIAARLRKQGRKGPKETYKADADAREDLLFVLGREATAYEVGLLEEGVTNLLHMT